MLELSRLYCPETTFIFTSTNKVYGDRPNQFQYLEKDLRYDLKKKQFFFLGRDLMKLCQSIILPILFLVRTNWEQIYLSKNMVSILI